MRILLYRLRIVDFIKWVTAPVNRQIFLASLLLMGVGVGLGGFSTSAALGLGALGMLLGVWGGALALAFRRQPRAALSIALRGAGVMLLPTVLLAYTLPPFRLSLAVSGTPQDLYAGNAMPDEANLPEHFSLHGVIAGDYTVTFSSMSVVNNIVSENTKYFTPLVAAGWQPGDPVEVVISTPPAEWAQLQTDPTGLQIVTGILYPVSSRSGEVMSANAPVVPNQIDWFQQNAAFEFNPGNFYFLDAVSVWSLRLPFLIVLAISAVAVGASYRVLHTPQQHTTKA
ncbi:MAG: hypothetical protein Kow0031_29370 [Anaerolineae bacterium]